MCGSRGDAGGVPVPRGSRRGPAAPRGRRTKSNRLQTMRGAALMDRSADQWDGGTAGRARRTANGRLRGAGLGGQSFLLMSVCAYGAETARVVTPINACPPPTSSTIGGFGLPGLNPKAWRGWGIGWGHCQKPTGPLRRVGPGPRCWWGFEHLEGPLASGCVFSQSLGKKLEAHPLK